MPAAVVFVAASGCTWQQLPAASFGPSGATGHYWRFMPYSWRRTPMSVELSGYERSPQTPHPD